MSLPSVHDDAFDARVQAIVEDGSARVQAAMEHAATLRPSAPGWVGHPMYEAGRDDERAAVVACLRRDADMLRTAGPMAAHLATLFLDYALAIERGEHRK